MSTIAALPTGVCLRCGAPAGRCACPGAGVADEASEMLELSPSPINTVALRRNIVTVAVREWERWNAGGRKTETDPRMRSTLADYWRRGARVPVREADLGSTSFQAAHPWSAAFISWVMRQSGAGSAFHYAPSHSTYIAAAKRNRLSNNSNPFKAYRVSEARPGLGDLVCKSRAGSGATYDNIRPGMKTHCDVVTAIEPGRLTVIGGNLNNTVGRKHVPISASGLLTLPEYFAVIKVGAGHAGPAPHPSPPTPPPSPAPSPPHSSAGGRTIYAPIDLGIRDGAGNRVRPQTGVFWPNGWRGNQPVDLVIYLHGIRDVATIETYWDPSRNPHFALREDLVASRRNAVLVAPLLGPRSQNQIGVLARPGGLDQFIARVLEVLRAHAGLSAGARVGNIILACHSGGGLAMRIIARAQNTAAPLIRECWGFDCTYNHDDSVAWGDWAKQRSDARLYMFYLANTRTAIQALKLQQRGIPNVRVVASRARGHNYVPRTHFLELLRASPALRDR